MSLADQPMVFTGSVAEEDLRITQFSIREQLGRPFQATIDLSSPEKEIPINDVLGQPAQVRVLHNGTKERFFHGIVSRFALRTVRSGEFEYRATLVPWFWLLTRSSDCKIYQEMSVPDIISAVFKDLGFSDYEMWLFEDHATRTYCVQYRETHFNFVSRLMEEEGIYFYFIHEDGKHTMVLTDSISGHEPEPGTEEIAFTNSNAAMNNEGKIIEWELDEEIQSGVLELRSYDFENVGDPLTVNKEKRFEHGHDGGKLFDYPANYVDTDVGGGFARNWLEAVQAEQQIATAKTDNRTIGCGRTIDLIEHPLTSQNKAYLIVETQQTGSTVAYGSGGGSDGGGAFQWRTSFSVIDKERPFRAPRITPKPVIRGPQTAMVTGPGGEKVHVDEYGRVKVMFHWDRYAPGDGGDSCWVRVSQNWAGDGWGGMFLPHIGHEVIVEFLEGDPDRPIITGRVYNGSTALPKKLPDNKYKSAIRDHYGNEILFDGTEGDEHIFMQSPTHSSVLMLGRSTHTWTESDSTKWTVGDTFDVRSGDSIKHTKGNSYSTTRGFSASATLGSSFSGTIGTTLGVMIGTKFDMTIAGNFSIDVGPKYKLAYSLEHNANKKSYTRTASGDIKFDSDDDVWLCGGKNDDSLLRVAKDRIELAFGKGDGNMQSNMLSHCLAAAGAATAIAQTVIAAVPWGETPSDLLSTNADAAARESENNAKQQQFKDAFSSDASIANDITNGALGGLAGALAVAAAFAAKSDKDPKHSTVKSKLVVDATGVLLQADAAGDGALIKVEKDKIQFHGAGSANVIFYNTPEIKFVDWGDWKKSGFQIKKGFLKNKSFQANP